MHQAILVLVPPGEDVESIMNRFTGDESDQMVFESYQTELKSIYAGNIENDQLGDLYPSEIGKPVKSVIKSIDELAKIFGYEKNPITGEFGYYYNPDQMGDYYHIGGRYNKWLDIHDRYKQEKSDTCMNCKGESKLYGEHCDWCGGEGVRVDYFTPDTMDGNAIPASELHKDEFAKHYQDNFQKKWDRWIEAVSPHINGRDPETLTYEELCSISKELERKHRFIKGFSKAHNINLPSEIFLYEWWDGEVVYPVKKEEFIHHHDKYVPAHAIISKRKYYANEQHSGFENDDQFYEFFWSEIESAPQGTIAVMVDMHS